MKKHVNTDAGRELSAKKSYLLNRVTAAVSKVSCKRDALHYMHNVMQMKHGLERDMLIFLTLAVVRVIKAKLDMPVPESDYLLESQKKYDAQIADDGGWFTVPFVKLALWNTQNGDYQQAIKSGTEGTKATAKAKLKKTLNQFMAYVNALMADDQTNAEAIASSARVTVILPPVKNKQDFTVKQAKATGSILLRCLAARDLLGKLLKANYEWQYSLDGLIWVDLPDTMKANTVAVGMEVGKLVWFRKRITTTKGGTTAWCTPKSITVQ
jgi:hypothetical protein